MSVWKQIFVADVQVDETVEEFCWSPEGYSELDWYKLKKCVGSVVYHAGWAFSYQLLFISSLNFHRQVFLRAAILKKRGNICGFTSLQLFLLSPMLLECYYRKSDDTWCNRFEQLETRKVKRLVWGHLGKNLLSSSLAGREKFPMRLIQKWTQTPSVCTDCSYECC